MHNNFDIRLGPETMAGRLQGSTQFLIIVDLSIAYHCDRVILVRDGLIPGFQIDNAQSAKTQADTRFNKIPVPIGSPVGKHSRHMMKHVPIDRPIGIYIRHASNSTHHSFPY
jgi:hypothetical protein